MLQDRRTFTVLAIPLCLIYILVRMWHLTDSCLWFDEIFSVHAAEHPWNSLFWFVAQDLIHPPLFYTLLKLWISIGGEGLFWLRLFPVLFSILAVIPFIALCSELKLSLGTRLLALFLFATNGSLIKYAQEVRMYSLLLCLALVSIWFFARFILKGKSVVPLLIINIILVHTHYFGWLIVLSEVVATIALQRRLWKRILMMFSITFISFIPWTMTVWQASQTGSSLQQNIGWMVRPGILEITKFCLSLIEPFYYAASSIDAFSNLWVSLPLILIFSIVAILFLINWKYFRGISESPVYSVYLLLILVTVPVLIAMTASWVLPYSIWGIRHLIVVAAPVQILLAIFVMHTRDARIRTAIVTLILLLSGYSFTSSAPGEKTRYSWCEWEPLTIYALEHASSNIYVLEDLVAYHVWRAVNADRRDGVTISKIENIGVTEDKGYFLPRGFESVTRTAFEDFNEEEFWLLYRAETFDRRRPPISLFLERGYQITSEKMSETKTEDAILLHFERSIKSVF